MDNQPKFCEYCGSELLENGRCPIEDCVWNVIIDALSAAEKKDKGETNK